MIVPPSVTRLRQRVGPQQLIFSHGSLLMQLILISEVSSHFLFN